MKLSTAKFCGSTLRYRIRPTLRNVTMANEISFAKPSRCMMDANGKAHGAGNRQIMLGLPSRCSCTQCSYRPVPLRVAETRLSANQQEYPIEDVGEDDVSAMDFCSCETCDDSCDELQMRLSSDVISTATGLSSASSSHLMMRATSLIS